MATPTRKDIKAAEERRISQIGDFKARAGGIMELPSGLTVKTFNPGGLQAFLKGGTIPNSLLSIVKESLAKGKAPDVQKFMNDGEFDSEMIDAMDTMLNNIAVKVIVLPKIAPPPAEGEERSDEILYADELPMDDKQFLLQWVSGGTRDLEEFRKKQREAMGDVAKESSAVKAAQRAAGIDPREL